MAVLEEPKPTVDESCLPARPLLRWAGSKRKQLSRLASFWKPSSHSRYIEPFAGSACLFFSLAPQRAVLGDLNCELIELYQVIRRDPELLHRRLRRIARDRDTYFRWRAKDPKLLDKETRALRFLYLNRNCFNGIYRTNLSGHFNVPMGRKLGPYPAKADFTKCAELLGKAKLIAGDFERTIGTATKGDFVYLDPPFAVSSRRVFREYGKHAFDTGDIERFSASLTSIASRGADFLVSYADCSEARGIAQIWNSIRLPVKRHIAGFAGARKNAYEWLITNMPIPPRIKS